MNITIGIVAYNEEKYLPSILEDITKQNYPHENIEIVLADSMSGDQTQKIMLQWQQQYQQQYDHNYGNNYLFCAAAVCVYYFRLIHLCVCLRLEFKVFGIFVFLVGGNITVGCLDVVIVKT